MSKPTKTTSRHWIAIGALLILVFLGGYLWLTWDLPEIGELPTNLAPASIRIVDRHERLLYELLPVDNGRHVPLPLSQIPLALQQATIATEDRYFYQNPGVDLRGILRAFWINLQGGETLAGGSTITQQVAKNLLLEPEERFERSLRRKLRESLLAWQLAQHYSKDEILALYLNQTYYGALAYGAEAAAQTFFGKPASELDLAESALIAGLPQAPALYNPLLDPQAALNRQKIVLELMLKQSLISSEAFELARRQELVFTSSPYPIEAPHFVIMIANQLDAIIPPESRPANTGLVIQTTLDLDWQHLAEKAVAQQLAALQAGLISDYELPGGHNVNNAALVALDPHTGAILALVGSPDYFDEQHAGAINMALMPRQPGSAIKPLVYAAAFNPIRPEPWTAGTMILDVGTTFITAEGKPYRPANYDGLEHGPVLARDALASSLNIPAVVTLADVGLPAFAGLAQSMGISTLGDFSQYDLSLALGGGEVSLLELSATYAVFANHGFRTDTYNIETITTTAGETLYRHFAPAQVRVLDQRVAWLISDILSDPEARATGFGTHSSLRLDRPAAVKTGTTTNFHDNWTIGYTPDLVVGVWVGNTSHEPMRDVTGLTGAAPIWHQFMRTVLTGSPEQIFQRPVGLVQIEVCALSGLLPTQDCPYQRLEWFISGTQPNRPDTFYHSVQIDTRTGFLAGPGTPASQISNQLVLDLPLEAQPWARTQGLRLLTDLQRPQTNQSAAATQDTNLRVLTPGNGAIYRLSASIGTSAQRLHIQIMAAEELNPVSLWLDGDQLIAWQGAPYEYWWTLEEGTHQLWSEGLSPSGETVISETITFEVEGNSNHE
ncbi:MAG: transglycosylase domain-containing protein [Anaerolineales bacterium]|nr:transglycosylase domain-containing protein [Anaerolineales bacterium]